MQPGTDLKALLRPGAFLVILYLASVYSFHLFSMLSQILIIALSLSVFLVIWNSSEYLENRYLLILGFIYFFISVIYTICLLLVVENFLAGEYATTVLKLSAGFLCSIAFIEAPLFIKRKIRPNVLFFANSLLALLVVAFSFFSVLQAHDLVIKIIYFLPYASVAVFLLGLILLQKNKKFFDKDVLHLLVALIFFNILAQFSLAASGIAPETMSMLADIFQLVGFYLSYLVIVEIGIMDPYKLMLQRIRNSEESIKEREEKYRVLSDTSPNAIFVHHMGKIIFINPAAAELCGIESLNEDDKKSMYDFIRQDYHSFFAKKNQALLFGSDENGHTYNEMKFVKADGTCVDIEEISVPIHYKGQEMIQTIVRDIGKKKRAEEKLKHMSTYDALTGLYNSFYLERQLQKYRGRREFNGSIIIMDINDLKKINDVYGHSMGNELIRMTAGCISDEFREEDVIARTGGDEFCVLLPNTDLATVSEIIKRMKIKMGQIKLKKLGNFSLSVSVGTAFASSGRELDGALKNATEMMISNKSVAQIN